MAVVTIPITVNLTVSGSTIDIDIPGSVPVRNSKTDTYKLVWTISGPNASFPASNFFNWRSSPGQPTVTRNPAGNQLTSTEYSNDANNRRKWKYTIGLTNGTTTINLDPEVDNEPPTPM